MGRGSSGISKKKDTPPTGAERLVDKRVNELGITTSNVEEQLGLSNLTTAQKNMLVTVFREMGKNDYSYDKNHTPYEIESIQISQPFKDGLSGSNDVLFYAVTNGNTGRESVDIFDTRIRRFYIGQRGGLYQYGRSGRKPVSRFDAFHGKRD